MSKIYVFGHKNPDSDTIYSALAYAELKKALGFDAVAIKLGELSNETKFILKYFDVTEPETISTIRTQVSDLQIDEAVCVPPSTTVHAAWQLLKKHGKKTLVVVNESQELVGLATLSDITKNFMDVNDDVLAACETPYQNIIDTLNAEVVSGTPNKHIAKGQIVIANQWHSKLKNYVGKGDIVIAGIRENIHEAILSGARLVICTCGTCPEKADIALAEERRCDIITTEYDTFITAILIRQSIPIECVMTTNNIVTVQIDELLDDVKERMTKTRYRNYPVIDGNRKVVGTVARYHLLTKRRKQAILVDHNEINQTADGIEEAEILEIIDHHRLGDIQTSYPVFMKDDR